MKIHILFFASVATQTGTRETVLEIGAGATAAEVLVALRERYPSAAGSFENVTVAVDAVYAPMNTVVHDGSRVAIIPPVSGG